MKHFSLILVLLCVLIPFAGYSQSNDVNATPVSGNASAAGKFESLPVNLYTGIAPVTIPLYAYKNQSGLGLDITLDYFLGGIKNNESATPVGLGWYMQAGGMVTRTVKGMPDDLGWKGYLYSNSATVFSVANQSKLYYDSLDAQQDIFQFNFNGSSGKFLIGKNKKIEVIPLSKIKIQYAVAADSSISSFSVVTENGLKYIFEDVESQYLGTNFPCGYNAKTYNTSWLLTKMISPFVADTIKFTYTTVYRTDVNAAYPQTAIIRSNGTVYRSFYPDGNINHTIKKISAITFPDGKKLDFVYDNTIKYDGNDYVLSVLRVSDSLLSHGYTFNWNLDGNSRCFLSNIVYFTRNAKKTMYTLGYRTSNAISNSIDHWGFYNGESNGSNTIPSVPSIYSGANREASQLNYESTLETVVDPSGGSTIYQTEPNDVIQLGQSFEAKSVTLTNTSYSGSVPATLSQINGTYNFTVTLANSARTGTYPFSGYCQLVVSISNGVDVSSALFNMSDLFQNGSSSWSGYNLPNGTYSISVYMNSGGPGCTILRDLPITISWQNNSVAGFSRPSGGRRIKTVLHADPSSNQTDTLATYIYKTVDGKSSGILGAIPKYDYPYQETVINGSTTVTGYTTIGSDPVNFLNYAQGSPVGYTRVEVIKGGIYKNSGKQVFEFTGLQDAGLGPQSPAFPYAPIMQRDWIMGMPKKISTYDSAGHLLKVTTNVYDTTVKSLNDSNFLSLKLGKTSATYYGNPLISTTPVAEFFQGQAYYHETGTAELMSTTDSIFHLNGSIQVSQQTIEYDTNYNAVKITTPYNKTKGLNLEKRIYYPYNYTVSGPIATLKTNNIINIQVSAETWITGDSNPRVVNISIDDFQQTGQGYIKPSISYTLQSNAPVAQSTIGTFNPASLVRNTTWIKPTREVSIIDNKGNPLEMKDIASGQSSSEIMDYHQQFSIAKVSNSKNSDIAYTSFESDGSGNWTIGSTLRDTAGGVTGKRGYNISNGSITKSGLNTALTYIISMWVKTGASVSANGGGLGGSLAQQNGWNFYMTNISSVSSVTLSGSGIIDELRLYPSNSTMITSTYDPFLGVTSTADGNSSVSYFEYDIMNRLKIVRDKDLNILKKYEYEDSTTIFSRPANWQNTGATRCITPLNGTQEIEQKDLNPYSDTYNIKKWVFGGANCTTCAPVCTGPANKLINCVCESGVRNNTATQRVGGSWKCTYVYCFSDGSSSATQTETNASPCTINGPCNQ